MDGIHDLGGRHGFGESLIERDEATFHASWEKRVHGMLSLLMAQGCFNVDQFRHAVERLDPIGYLRDGYYGRWLAATELIVDEAEGRLTRGRFSNTKAGRSLERPPRFALGDTVKTKHDSVPGHTRLPGYARGRRGTIAMIQGGWVLPDTHAHGLGESPNHVYSVRFDGRELWGAGAEPDTFVHLDLFERYLEPA